MARAPKHIYAALRIDRRPKDDTPLSLWLKQHQLSHFQLAARLRCDPKMVRYWASGRCIPGLVYAFRIEQETSGAVPVASWLGTELGRALWEHTGRDISTWAPQKNQDTHIARIEAKRKKQKEAERGSTRDQE